MEHPERHPDNADLPVINSPATIRGVVITFLLLVFIAIGLRVFVRLREQLWGWDDVIILGVLIPNTTGLAMTCLMPSEGMGLHFWTLPRDITINYFKHVWATNTCYIISATLIKLSILFQYLRLFEGQVGIARLLTLTLQGTVAVWGITFFLLAMLSCHPIEKNWKFEVPGTCVAWGSKDPDVFFGAWAAHAATNMFLDILVFALPMPFLRSLRMAGKTKLGFLALFLMGGIVVSLSVARLVALSINRAGTVPVFDVTYATPGIYIFSVLEINIAILCASIPIFWPFVSSLASNKILVVNEIEVRTSRRNSQSIALNDQCPEEGHPFGIPHDFKGEDPSGRTSRISVFATPSKSDSGSGLKQTLTRTTSRFSRHHNTGPPSTHQNSHNRKTSSLFSSASKDKAIEVGSRPSQDSQHNLRSMNTHPSLSHHSSTASLQHTFSASPESHHSPLDQARHVKEGSAGATATNAHYQDRYVQDWAVPDFDKSRGESEVSVGGGGDGGGANSTTTTTVERAAMPFDVLRTREQ